STAGRRINEKQLDAKPAEPPSASPSPLRGQVETNQPVSSEKGSNQPNEAEAERAFQQMIARRPTGARGNAARLEAQRAAFDLGWQGYLQRGRSKATQPVSFENVEPELAQW